MSRTSGLVYVVDDDVSVREGVASLIRSAGLEARVLASGQEFLAIPWPEVPSCLVLDVELPGLSGLDVQQELVRSGVHIPIIFLTGRGDIPMSVRAIQAGAADFLTKPFEGGHLLGVIRRCIGGYHTYNRQPQNQLNDKLIQEKLCLQDEARSAVSFAGIRKQCFPAQGPQASRNRSADRLDSADLRRDRHRQGTHRPRRPQTIPAVSTRLRQCELRCHPARLDCLRIVRS